MATIIATPGAANANSFETLAEAVAYFETRIPIPEWEAAPDQEMLLIMATRILCALAQPFKTLVRPANGTPYYVARRQWTGQATDAVQALAWPRIGMLSANGFVIDSTVIPQALKDAESELAGQLAQGDRTLDNDVIVQGLNALKVGSVSLNFNQGILAQVIPDAVYNLMPVSWLTEEVVTQVYSAEFDVISVVRGRCW